jgi:DNA-binding SARP family transcriptional activator
VGERSHALPPQLPSWLLAYLALLGRPVAREQVLGVFWPDRTEADAQRNLRANLHRLRDWLHEVQAGELLHATRSQLSVDLASDVAQFHAALRGGRAEEALALYEGPLLTDWLPRGFAALEDWLTLEREQVQRACRQACLELLAKRPPAARALDVARRLADADALDETLHVALGNALLALGQAGAAHEQGQALAARLKAELAARPGAALAALLERAGQALATAGASEEQRSRAQAHIERAAQWLQEGEAGAADARLSELLPTLRDPALRLQALVQLGRARAAQGQIDAAAALAAEARELERTSPAAEPMQRFWLALLEHIVLIRQGQAARAFDALAPQLEAARSLPPSSEVASLWLSMSTWHIDNGRDAEGAEAARRTIEVARACADDVSFVFAAANLLAAQQRLGAAEVAFPLAEAALAMHRVDGTDLLRANLARAHLLRGEPWRALPHAQRLVVDASGGFLEPVAFAALGDALIGVGRSAEGHAALHQALRALDANSIASVRARVILSALESGEAAFLPQVRALLPALTGAQLQAQMTSKLERACAVAGIDFRPFQPTP